MYTKPIRTQIYADLTQINADGFYPRPSVCNPRVSALKFRFPKKKLGQNFLSDKNIQRKIIAACELKASDIVIEIGAGRGELTKCIADNAAKVYAIEIDSYLCQLLKDKFRDNAHVKIINQDILGFNLSRCFVKDKNTAIKAIGNIPYYITTPIIEHLIKYRDKIETIFITVQKEFAKRMTARPGGKDYGSFSCFIQYYTEPKIIFTIKKTSFFPVPKVDSCFLRLNIRKKPMIKLKNERMFFKIIRAAFNQRRKTLRNSLDSVISPQNLDRFFTRYNINPNIRPEELTLKDFAGLASI